MRLKEAVAGAQVDVPVAVRVLGPSDDEWVAVLLEDDDGAVARLMRGDTPVIHVHSSEVEAAAVGATEGKQS